MLSPTDRERLRRLAGAYADIVNSDDLARRRDTWRLSNRLEQRTVPFQIEDNGTFFADVLPAQECEDGFARGAEAFFLRALTNYRLIPDDRLYPQRFPVHWAVSRTSLCPELKYRRVPDATGRELGYETNTPLADLESGLAKLRPTEYSVNREETARQVELAETTFGDLLPVELIGRQISSASAGLANKAVLLMGMDALYMAMMDQPENVHRFFDFVTTDNARFMDWLEAEGLVAPGTHEFDCGSGSCVHTDELPRRTVADPAEYRASDCWGFVEAQEAVGLSPTTYAEFIAPYQRRLGDRFGLINYGCCEPVHTIWPILREVPNLRKVTVSPWCDVPAIAAAAGRQVVLSRKPHPLKLCGPEFEASEFRAHLQETLEITRDNFIELIFRDTCTLNGGMQGRLLEACAVLHELTGH